MNTLADFRRWVSDAAALDAMVPASKLDALLDGIGEVEARDPVALPDAPSVSWRERLWTVPAETRLGVAEVAEAMGRPKSYVYARTGPKAEDPLPHRKLDGSVVLTAGELRAWIREHEEVVHAGPYLSVREGS